MTKALMTYFGLRQSWGTAGFVSVLMCVLIWTGCNSEKAAHDPEQEQQTSESVDPGAVAPDAVEAADALELSGLHYEVHHQVVTYEKPKPSESLALEVVREKEDHKYLAVFCSLEYSSTGRVKTQCRIRGRDNVRLTDENGATYAPIGTGQYRHFGQVRMSAVGGSKNLSAKGKPRAVSWVFEVPAEQQVFTLSISGAVREAGRAEKIRTVNVSQTLTLPKHPTTPPMPACEVLRVTLRDEPVREMPPPTGTLYMLVKFRLSCPERIRSFVLNTPAITFQPEGGQVVHPFAEQYRLADGDGFVPHVSRLVQAGKPRDLTFCFPVNKGIRMGTLRFAARPLASVSVGGQIP